MLKAKYLLFDFETSGIGDFKKQKALQLAWQLCDKKMKSLKKYSYYFNDISEWNKDFHKNITHNFILENGKDPQLILNLFLSHASIVCSNSGKLIAHNVNFDFQILKNECEKNNVTINDDTININNLKNILYCTMVNTTHMCGIPRNHGGGNKYPKLSELYSFLYKEKPDLELHEASNDVEILRRCCVKLF
tara:strand:+ start:164 stop:736 length:573 start_codon:yes stop_codon:yes gene_type:complete